jgi:starch synthase
MQALRRSPRVQAAGHAARPGAARPLHRPPDAGVDERLERLLFVTSEMSDFVKAGGLGEVSAALPRALRQAHDIRVLIPGYPRVVEGVRSRPSQRLPSAFGLPSVSSAGSTCRTGSSSTSCCARTCTTATGSPYVDGTGADWSDNDIRFARLALAAADLACGLDDLGWQPDLVHVNDWPSALTPAYLAWRERSVPTILTIHNLAYQGLFDSERLPALGIPEDAFQIDGVEFYGKLSFLKAGIFYASHITTVSSTYARRSPRPSSGAASTGCCGPGPRRAA